MSNTYTIGGEGTTIKVRGRLNKSGNVTVKKNDVVYQFNKSQGQTDFGAVSATLNRDDGGYINEGAVSQEIHLPDGTVIEKSAATQKARLPDGRVIEGKNPNGTSFTIQSNDKNSTISISLSSSSSDSLTFNSDLDVKQSHSTDSNNSSAEEDNPEQKDEVLRKARSNLISGITPGFWTMVFLAYGFVFASQSAAYIGIFMYVFFAVPAIIQYIGSLLTTSNISMPELSAENEEKNDELSYPEKQKQKFLEGKISEKEFEERIEEHFKSNAKNDNLSSTSKDINLETV